MKWTVFDLEFTELLPGLGQDWPPTLRISCGAIFSSGDNWPQVWHEKATDASGTPGDYMSELTLIAFVEKLESLVADGHRIATWGGSATDWRLLVRECPSKADIVKTLALESVDLPMCACMSIGMMMGLNAACMALGFTLKDSEASANVPALWATRNLSTRNQVLQHVSNDAYATMLVLKHAETNGGLPWITLRGQLKLWSPVNFWSVRACLARELPHVPFQIQPQHNAKLLARWLLLM